MHTKQRDETTGCKVQSILMQVNICKKVPDIAHVLLICWIRFGQLKKDIKIKQYCLVHVCRTRTDIYCYMYKYMDGRLQFCNHYCVNVICILFSKLHLPALSTKISMYYIIISNTWRYNTHTCACIIQLAQNTNSIQEQLSKLVLLTISNESSNASSPSSRLIKHRIRASELSR